MLGETDDLEQYLVEVTEPADKPHELVPPSKVEVRILREEPDLIGELLSEPTAAAVDLLAYLVLHDHPATTSRLRDSIGTTRTQASRSGKTVWSAASAARKVLGTDLFPGASGNQLYKLSTEVTCDWSRFLALVEIARQSESDSERRRDALTQALELVDGVPAIASRRFLWLDDGRILGDITKEVVSVSAMLADLEFEVGSSEIARWALDKGFMLSPSDGQLLRLQQLLNQSTAVSW